MHQFSTVPGQPETRPDPGSIHGWPLLAKMIMQVAFLLVVIKYLTRGNSTEEVWFKIWKKIQSVMAEREGWQEYEAAGHRHPQGTENSQEANQRHLRTSSPAPSDPQTPERFQLQRVSQFCKNSASSYRLSVEMLEPLGDISLLCHNTNGSTASQLCVGPVCDCGLV